VPAPFALAIPTVLAVLVTLAAPASAARLMNYNLLNWSSSTGPARAAYMRAIVRAAAPDIVVSQEVIGQGGVDVFRDQVLNTMAPGNWVAAPFLSGPDTNNSLWYRPDVWTLVDTTVVWNTPRYAMRYQMRLTGYNSPGADLYVYSFHLKSSMGFETERGVEMDNIRANAEALPPGSHIVFCGDYNVYTSTEPAFQKALASLGANIGRMKDPINQVGNWHDNAGYAPYHTQSPRTLSFGGGATGGMDDRFDFILESYNLDDNQGFELLESTYKAFGNDGAHLNVAINASPTNSAVGQALADSIMNASDHIPVVTTFSVPAKLDVAPLAIAFGTVIQGAVVTPQGLQITNVAASPGDALDGTVAAPVGFTVGGGAFSLAPGVNANASIGLVTSSVGVKSGDLTIASDAPDDPTKLVPVSATVVAHAVPSVDSLSAQLAGTLDFGSHDAGLFDDMLARVYNVGYGALQAKLRVGAASITGGDGRFALVEPFAPILVELDPALVAVHFDDAGATSDSTYTATLVFDTADDPSLPGAVAQAQITYDLLARVTSSTVAVDPSTGLVTVTVLYAPRPNPAPLGRSVVRFDLAQPGRVRLALYDVRGREVARLVDGETAAGAHARSWDGRDAQGRAVPGGVYFARLIAPGVGPSTVRFVVLP
jgi:hypothetical protein